MATEDRGFASMDRDKQREIASKGGRAAHKKGAAHEWTREEAQAAGRKGGLARHRRAAQSTTVIPADEQVLLDEQAPPGDAALPGEHPNS
jgi:general stress protein YciG